MNPCEIVYTASQTNAIYGNVSGMCRITGEESVGVNFDSWIKDTFTDIASLKPGTIISNAALFCFDEHSEIIKEKTGKDKLQRFRTYSHIVKNGEWFCLTKAHKQDIFNLICNDAELICLTDSGQKHLLFKHKVGMWQLDDIYIIPDIPLFKFLHENMCELMRLGFSQGEIIENKYIPNRIIKAGFDKWVKLESLIKEHRGKRIFEFASWMLFISEEDKEENQKRYEPKPRTVEPERKNDNNGQLSFL